MATKRDRSIVYRGTWGNDKVDGPLGKILGSAMCYDLFAAIRHYINCTEDGHPIKIVVGNNEYTFVMEGRYTLWEMCGWALGKLNTNLKDDCEAVARATQELAHERERAMLWQEERASQRLREKELKRRMYEIKKVFKEKHHRNPMCSDCALLDSVPLSDEEKTDYFIMHKCPQKAFKTPATTKYACTHFEERIEETTA